MSFEFFLLVATLSVASLNVAYTDEPGKPCPYGGEKDQSVLDKLHSKDYRNSLPKFAQLFLKAIPSENFFFKQFDTSFKNGTIHRTFFLNCVYWETTMGLECPIKLCKTMAGKVEKAFETKLTALDYFLVLSGTLEDSLKEEGKTMDEDATSKMLKTFVDDLARQLCTPDMKGPEDALFVLDEGTINFFRRLGVSDKKDLESVANSFGDQFAKVGKKSSEIEVIVVPYTVLRPIFGLSLI